MNFLHLSSKDKPFIAIDSDSTDPSAEVIRDAAGHRDLFSQLHNETPDRIRRMQATIAAAQAFREPAVVFETDGERWAVPASERAAELGASDTVPSVIGLLPGIFPEWLGSRAFVDAVGSRFPYAVGEMARGITSPRMVVAAVEAGFCGFLGSAGLRPPTIREAVREIMAGVGPGTAWGANLIHAPEHAEVERAVVDVFLEEKVRNVSASAFMTLSPDIVRYAARGLHRDATGEVARDNRVFAKISRTEVASHFLAPPPANLLRDLVAAGDITAEQAELQSTLPVAEFLTVESDSGGHTDNRPLGVLFPLIVALRAAMIEKHGYRRPVFLGAAGGIGTPDSLAAAYALGADFAVTGSINQSAVESGLAEDGRALLCQAGMADMAMAPSADMFELGVKVQVLKRGTMFAQKALRLYDLYRGHGGFEELSAKDRAWIEGQVLQESFDSAWEKTRAFHAGVNPALAAKADADSKRRMALVFRRYLFMGSQWARDGLSERRTDYQIWCGPAMGGFNDWVAGTFLEPAESRTVRQIGLNLLEGAAQITRAQQLRTMGVDMPTAATGFRPRPLTLD